MVMEAWVSEAIDDWMDAYGPGTLLEGRTMLLALGPAVKAYGWEKVRPCWNVYLKHVDEQHADPRSFARMVPIVEAAKTEPPKPERMTEARLAAIEREQRNQTQLEPARDYSLTLVAEVRRLREIIMKQAFFAGIAGGRKFLHAELRDEAEVIRDEEKVHE